MSDLTLISKISNEAINENLKKRFENAEIYVSLYLGWRVWDWGYNFRIGSGGEEDGRWV